jgi:hypothetical protein
MDLHEPHLSLKDICVIFHVCKVSEDRFFNEFNIPAIVHRLKTNCDIDNGRYQTLLQRYGNIHLSPKEFRTIKREFFDFIILICKYVGFFAFCEALKQAGFDKLSKKIIDSRLEKQGQKFISRRVWRRELPNDEKLHAYYVKEKSKIDNNVYKNQARDIFRKEIATLNGKIDINVENKVKLQYLIDKRCILYFLLCQQYASEPEADEVLMEMRNVMPQDVDRTLFDTMFHSYMAFNRASSGQAERAEKHIQLASSASFFCARGFVCILVSLWSQYANTILYSQSRDKSLYCRANSNFITIQQCLQDVYEWDERHIWKTISELDMLRATVGITPKLEMCAIENIDDNSISQAKTMAKHLKEPKEIRRKMYYKVILARISEKSDPVAAIKYITTALELATDGCYDDRERNKLLNYLETCRNELPRPSF